MVQKISSMIPEERLQADLEKYRRQCLGLGAADAKIIPSDNVVIDERVRAKCVYPRCSRYGTNAHCPPHAMDLEQVRKTVIRYRYGIFFRVEVPSEEIAGKDATTRRVRSMQQTYKIVSAVESAAFYDGYHLALGFACGPCQLVFCHDEECSALKPGQPCRHPLKARGSMEGAGMDVFTMAARVGWDVYPIGRSTTPADVPYGANYGLVLIH
jgi:predicted metal-binding protein